MLTALIPTIAQIVVSTSAGGAIDSAVKRIVPLGIKALPAFGIKVATAVGAALIGAKVGAIAETNLREFMSELKSPEAQEVPAQEDN